MEGSAVLKVVEGMNSKRKRGRLCGSKRQRRRSEL
jgi:hypothetical protein